MRFWHLLLLAAEAGAVLAEPPEGAAIFRRGDGLSAGIAGTSLVLDGRAVACAGCHGEDGRGPFLVAEGGQPIPPINAAALSRPTAARPAYDAASFARALTEGVASDGRPLASEMPRFRIEAGLADVLFQFLGQLEREQTQGLLPDRMNLALPADKTAGTAALAAMAAFNGGRGFWGRRPVEGSPAFLDLGTVLTGLSARLDEARQARLAGLAKEIPGALLLSETPKPPLPRGRHIVADAGLVGPLAQDLQERGNRLTLLAPPPEAMAWAKARGFGADAAEIWMLTSGTLTILAGQGRGLSLLRAQRAIDQAEPADWLYRYDF